MEFETFHSLDGQAHRVPIFAKGPCQHDKGFDPAGLMGPDEGPPLLTCAECGSRFTVRQAEMWSKKLSVEQ